MKFTLIIFLALVPLLLIVSFSDAAKSKDAASHQSKSAADGSSSSSSGKAKQSASKSGGASAKKSAAAAAAHQAKSAVAPGADSSKSKYGQLKAGEHKAQASLEAKASKQSSAALAKEKHHQHQLNQEAAAKKAAQNHHEAAHSAKAAAAAAAAKSAAAAAKESAAAAAKAAEGKASHHPHHHHSEISSAKHLESAAAPAPASKHGSEAVQGSAKAASAQLHHPQHHQQHSPSQSKSSAESSAAAAESSAKNHPHQKSPSSAAEAAAKKTAVDASKETSSAVKRNHNQYHHQTEYGQQPAYLTNTYHHPKPTYSRPNSYNHHNQHYSKPVHNVYHQEATYGQSQQYGNNDNYQQDTLIQANVIARLGDRTPFWLPRNDYYKEKDFPEGLNQLINVGKERLVNYGRVLRNRYQNLINNLRLKDISAQSASDRSTVESALALLAGLLPPVGSQVWSSTSASGSYNVDELARLWQPNAVFTVEAQRDWKQSTEAPCRTAQLVENVTIIETVPQLKHFLAVNREVIRRLEVLTGEDFTHDLSWLWIANVYDTYLSEAEYFGPAFYPPRWADERTLAVLREANQLKFSVWGHDQAYLRLRAGPLLQEITENLIKAAKNEAAGSSLALYSTFDSNIAVLEHSLGVFRGGQAGYGSGLLLELHRDAYHKGAEPVVALFSVDVPSGVKISQIDLSRSARFAKHCYSAGPNCPLSSFVVALQNHLLTLAEAEVKCNNN